MFTDSPSLCSWAQRMLLHPRVLATKLRDVRPFAHPELWSLFVEVVNFLFTDSLLLCSWVQRMLHPRVVATKLRVVRPFICLARILGVPLILCFHLYCRVVILVASVGAVSGGKAMGSGGVATGGCVHSIGSFLLKIHCLWCSSFFIWYCGLGQWCARYVDLFLLSVHNAAMRCWFWLWGFGRSLFFL